MKKGEVAELSQTIETLRAKLASLEEQLASAMQSGDQATQELRK